MEVVLPPYILFILPSLGFPRLLPPSGLFTSRLQAYTDFV